MTDTAQVATTETAQSTATIPKFCPICGALMAKQSVDGVLCWVCPECGYTEPV